MARASASRVSNPATKHVSNTTRTANSVGNLESATMCFGNILIIGPAALCAKRTTSSSTLAINTTGSRTNNPATVVVLRNSQASFMEGQKLSHEWWDHAVARGRPSNSARPADALYQNIAFHIYKAR